MQQCSFDRNIVQFYGALSFMQCYLSAFLPATPAYAAIIVRAVMRHIMHVYRLRLLTTLCPEVLTDGCRLLCEPPHAGPRVHGGGGPVVGAERPPPRGAAVVRPRPQPRSGHRQGPALSPRAQGKTLLLP